MFRRRAAWKTHALTSAKPVAAMTRNARARSGAWNFRRVQRIVCSRDHCAMRRVALGATTRTRAPARSTPAIFSSASLPAPTTTHRRPSSLRNTGKSAMGINPLCAGRIRSMRIPASARSAGLRRVKPPACNVCSRCSDNSGHAAGYRGRRWSECSSRLVSKSNPRAD